MLSNEFIQAYEILSRSIETLNFETHMLHQVTNSDQPVIENLRHWIKELNNSAESIVIHSTLLLSMIEKLEDSNA